MLKYLPQLNNPRRGKIIVLSVAGIILLVLFLFAFWRQYFADNLIQYVPNNAVFYAHFSLPLSKNSEQFNDLFLKVLADNNLGGLKLDDVDREAALIGQLKDNKLIVSVLIKTDHQNKLKKYFNDHDLAYKFLNRNLVLVSPAPELLSDFLKNKKNAVALSTKGKLSHFNSLSIYVAKPFFTLTKDDAATAMLSGLLSDQNGNLYVNVQIKRGGLKVGTPMLRRGELSKLVPAKAVIPVDNNYDLIFSADRLGDLISGWTSRLGSVSPVDYNLWQNSVRLWQGQYASTSTDLLLNKLADAKALLLIKDRPEHLDWFVSDYDFYLSFDLSGGNFNENDIIKLENIAKSIMAQKYPTEKSVYLDDGTRIIEIRPDIADFKFINQGGVKTLITPDKKYRLSYKLTSNKIEIFNNSDLASQAEKLSLDGYLKISRKFLPNNDFWPYVELFNYIELNGGEVYLK